MALPPLPTIPSPINSLPCAGSHRQSLRCRHSAVAENCQDCCDMPSSAKCQHIWRGTFDGNRKGIASNRSVAANLFIHAVVADNPLEHLELVGCQVLPQQVRLLEFLDSAWPFAFPHNPIPTSTPTMWPLNCSSTGTSNSTNVGIW